MTENSDQSNSDSSGALQEAERRMLLRDDLAPGENASSEDEETVDAGANAGHDPQALEDAAERMLLRHDRT